MGNFINSNYRTLFGGKGGLTSLTINGVAYIPDKEGVLLLPDNFATTDQLFSGNYNDLTNKPVIPPAPVNADWNATEGLAEILNKPSLFSGSYVDLSNKPDLTPLASAIQSASSAGTGTAIYWDESGTNLRFRSIKAGDNVSLSTATDGTITITAAGSSGPAGESNTSSSLGTGISLVAPKNGVDLPFRSLLSSAGLTWSAQTATVTLTLDLKLRSLISNNYWTAPLTIEGITASPLILSRTNIDGNNSIHYKSPSFNRYLGLRNDGELGWSSSLDLTSTATTNRVHHDGNQLNIGTTPASAQAAIDINQAGFPFTNSMTDSGRFSGLVDPYSFAVPATFENNSMLIPYNGSVWSDAGEFIFNNTNNGGTGGTMTADVVSLMQALGRGSDRYGVEFHIGNLKQGTGTSADTTATNGVVCYLSTVNNSQAIFAAESWGTYVFWARAKTGTLSFYYPFYLNGVYKPVGTAIVPTDGWVHIRVTAQYGTGYNNAFPGILGSHGADIQIGLPAVFPGKVDVGFHKAPIASSPAITALFKETLPPLNMGNGISVTSNSTYGFQIDKSGVGSTRIATLSGNYTHYYSSTGAHYFYGSLVTQANLTVSGTLLANGLSGKLAPAATNLLSSGMYGVYDSYKIGHVWCMGSQWSIPDNGANFGTLYGLAYKHTNNTTGGTMAGGHQIVVVQNGTAGIALGMGGNIWCSGMLSAVSDIRVKADIQVIPNAVDKVKALRGVTYARTDREGPRETGVIAQEVLAVLPEAITGDEDKYSVSYGNMVGLLIEAIKEQQLQIDSLQERLDDLTK